MQGACLALLVGQVVTQLVSPVRFVEKLLFMLPAFHGVFRSMCLEVLLSQADIRPTLYQELKDKGFHDMLKFK